MNDESIFHEALARRTPSERADYLDHACAGNPELRASVEGLLEANDGATGFLEGRPPVVGPPGEAPGACIGPYQLLQPLGEGGMGTVWMAQQSQPVRRQVALKLIKRGMDSKQVVARFEQERQALAL